MINNELKHLIKEVKCISFDVFDTVLLRPYVTPDDLFFHIEKMYGYAGYAEARKKAERDAWNKYRTIEKEDISLNEIYSEISIKYKECQKIEELMEYKVSIKNQEVYEIYSYALKQGKKVIFTSDMYLPKADIIKMLHKSDYNKYEDIFVSNEYGKLKNTGNLYKEVTKRTSLSPDEILHIGDNLHSDIEAAQKNGLKTYLYPSVLTQYLRVRPWIKQFIEKHPHNVTASTIVMLSAINCVMNKDKDYWYNFGYEYNGPLSTGFLFWIVKNLPQKIKDIVFIARDGYTLKKIMDNIFGKNFKTYYVYAPRSLNLICQLNYEKNGRFTFEHTKTLIDYYKNKSPILKEAPNISSAEEGVKYIEENKKEFEKLAINEKNRYKDYLKSQNINTKCFGLIDTVSMFFSAQKFIASILPKSNIEGYYYLIQRGAHIQPNTHSFKEVGHYAPDLSLVEFMMSSPESPILSIQNGQPIYKKDISEYEKKRQKACEMMSQGALSFADMLKQLFDCSKLNFDVSILTDWVNTLIQNPNASDKKQFLDVLCAYDPQHQDYRAIFPEWYARQEKKFYLKEELIKKEKHILFGFPFDKIFKQQQVIWSFLGIPLLCCKIKGSVKRYKLLKILPIWKVRKIYYYSKANKL